MGRKVARVEHVQQMCREGHPVRLTIFVVTVINYRHLMIIVVTIIHCRHFSSCGHHHGAENRTRRHGAPGVLKLLRRSGYHEKDKRRPPILRPM